MLLMLLPANLPTILWIAGVVLIGLMGMVFHMVEQATTKQRIQGAIASRQGRLLHFKKAQLGWSIFAHESLYVYDVRYLDQHGNEHQARLRTQILAGTQWKDDEIVTYANAGNIAALRHANQRLKAEIQTILQNNAFEIETLQRDKQRLKAEISQLRRRS